MISQGVKPDSHINGIYKSTKFVDIVNFYKTLGNILENVFAEMLLLCM